MDGQLASTLPRTQKADPVPAQSTATQLAVTASTISSNSLHPPQVVPTERFSQWKAAGCYTKTAGELFYRLRSGHARGRNDDNAWTALLSQFKTTLPSAVCRVSFICHCFHPRLPLPVLSSTEGSSEPAVRRELQSGRQVICFDQYSLPDHLGRRPSPAHNTYVGFSLVTHLFSSPSRHKFLVQRILRPLGWDWESCHG